MCIIIDTCVLASVFDVTSADHGEFAPIRKWIYKGKGKMIYGGTKYKQEIPPKYYRILIELENMNKTVRLLDKTVDTCQKEVENKIKSRKYNDPHLVAIAIVSRCRLVTTCDIEAKNCLREKRLYPKKMARPKIYSGKSNVNLIHDKNIVSCCD